MPFARDIEPWRLVIVGVVGGVLGGGLGLGGGFIMVPLLVALGFDRHRAHATSLAAIFLIAVVGALSFGISGELNLRLGLLFGIGGVLGSPVGAQLMHRASPGTIRLVFDLVLLAVGIRMLLTGGANALFPDLGAAGEIVIAVTVGALAGLVAGLAGVGGGLVMVPASVFLLGLTQHEAQGTSLVAVVLTASAASVVNVRNGRLRLTDGITLGAAGAMGSLAGSRLALIISNQALSRVFGGALLVIAARSIFIGIANRPLRSARA